MTTETEAAAKLAEEAHRKPQLVEVEHAGVKAQVLLLPGSDGGYAFEVSADLCAPLRAAPERREGKATFTDLESFIGHTKRFADTDSAAWMVRRNGGATLVSVLDYHRKGAEGAPRHGKHRGEYSFPLSDEWSAWVCSNGKYMGQEEFARWLEDHLPDVAAPEAAGEATKELCALLGCTLAAPSRLLELSRGLDVHVGQRVKQHVRLGSGEVSVQFQEEHSDAGGQPLKVPGAFLLGIPVFRGGDLYSLAARLRYRVKEGTVLWAYELHRAQALMDDALDKACKDVASECGIDVFEGTPE